MNILMIINGAAYGQDATYNAVRLAASMAKREEVGLRHARRSRGAGRGNLPGASGPGDDKRPH